MEKLLEKRLPWGGHKIRVNKNSIGVNPEIDEKRPLCQKKKLLGHVFFECLNYKKPFILAGKIS